MTVPQLSILHACPREQVLSCHVWKPYRYCGLWLYFNWSFHSCNSKDIIWDRLCVLAYTITVPVLPHLEHKNCPAMFGNSYLKFPVLWRVCLYFVTFLIAVIPQPCLHLAGTTLCGFYVYTFIGFLVVAVFPWGIKIQHILNFCSGGAIHTHTFLVMRSVCGFVKKPC